MTEEELKKIRERCDAATPGPWVGDEYEMLAPKAPVIHPGKIKIVWADDYHMNEWDAAFISFAREDIPRLLDEVADLKKRSFHSDQQYYTQKMQTDDFQLRCKRLEDEVQRLREALRWIEMDTRDPTAPNSRSNELARKALGLE